MTTLPHTTAPQTPAKDAQLLLLSDAEAADALEKDRLVLVDVREPFERPAEWIAGSVSAPLSAFDPVQLRQDHEGKQLVFHCRSGARSADAAKRFQKANDETPVYSLEGGIEAWKQSGHAVERSQSAPKLDVMRQVQMTAGALVAGGVLLSATLSPWFLLLPGFVGCGLMFAGASGWCGMAKLLARMPWNGGAACATASRKARSCQA